MIKFKFNDIIQSLDIDPVFINVGLSYADEKKYNYIRVMPLNHYEAYGFTSSKDLYKFKLDTSQFHKHNFIDSVTLTDYIGLSKEGLEGLYSLRDNLKYLTFENPNVKLDFIHLPNIETLYFKYNPGVSNLNSLLKLKDLLIFSLKTPNCNILSELMKIELLRFSGGTFASLEGIEPLALVNRVDIGHNSKIEDATAVNYLSGLKLLKIEKCPKLRCFTFLKDNPYIKELNVDSVDSLHFVPFMPNLEKINFLDCEDGNLAPLLESGSLKEVYFYPNKKHYTHTLEEIEKLLNNRNS